MNNRKLILYIACSLDGYIAKPNDDLSFLKIVESVGEDYGYEDFIKNVDTVIVGRRTYDWLINQGYDFPHADKESYIITRQEKPQEGNLTFYNGDLSILVKQLKQKSGQQIFCDGGAEIVTLLLGEKLIDEIILSVVPVLIGDGIRLFKDQRPEQKLQLLSTKSYDSGLVQLHYSLL